MTNTALVCAAALGGHLVHVIVIGGALLLAATVYGVASITAPREITTETADRSTPAQTRPALEQRAHPKAGAQLGSSSCNRGTASAVARQLAFVGLGAAAGTHLAVMPDHFEQSWIYGTFFAVVAPLQIGLGYLVLARPRRAELSAALAFSLAVVALWAITRFVGVPIGPDNGATEGLGVLDIFATGAEMISAGALIHLLRSRPQHDASVVSPVWRWSLWPPLTRVLLALMVLTVPLLSFFASRS
jgi:hypothetical protein